MKTVYWQCCVLAAVLLLIGGCARPPGYCVPAAPVVSQVPVPTGYPLSTQPKMQALHHWDVLADDVAAEIQQVLRSLFPERPIVLFVAASGVTSFEKAFQELLVTRLVKTGFLVSRYPQDAMVLNVDIQLVTHAQGRILQVHNGLYKSLAPGFFVRRNTPLAGLQPINHHARLFSEMAVFSAEVNTEAGLYTLQLPRNEVLVTLSLAEGSIFIYRNSSAYYIDDDDWWHYRFGTRPQQAGGAVYHLLDYIDP